MKTTLPLLLILGAALAAQDSAPVSGVDVHIIAVQTLDGGDLPEVHAEAIRRYSFGEGTSSPEQPSATWGMAPGILRLKVGRPRHDQMELDYRFSVRRMTWSSKGERIELRGGVKGFENFGWGHRTRFGRAFRYLVFIPWDEPGELEPWTSEAYANWFVRFLMDSGTVDHVAANAMLHMPLARLVDAPLLARFREWVNNVTPSRDRRGGGRNRGNMGRGMFHMPPEDLALGLRLTAGDPDAIDDIRNRANNWLLKAPLHLAFLQVGDPILKGQAGWMLVRPTEPGRGGFRERDLIIPYFELAEAGELVIPGSPEEQARRHAMLANWVAAANPIPALVVIAVAGLLLFGVAFAARRVALKLAM